MVAVYWEEEDFPSAIGKDLLPAELLVDYPTSLRAIRVKNHNPVGWSMNFHSSAILRERSCAAAFTPNVSVA